MGDDYPRASDLVTSGRVNVPDGDAYTHELDLEAAPARIRCGNRPTSR
jgi:hypothetical protein